MKKPLYWFIKFKNTLKDFKLINITNLNENSYVWKKWTNMLLVKNMKIKKGMFQLNDLNLGTVNLIP